MSKQLLLYTDIIAGKLASVVMQIKIPPTNIIWSLLISEWYGKDIALSEMVFL
jgi:hypothetical protein